MRSGTVSGTSTLGRSSSDGWMSESSESRTTVDGGSGEKCYPCLRTDLLPMSPTAQQPTLLHRSFNSTTDMSVGCPSSLLHDLRRVPPTSPALLPCHCCPMGRSLALGRSEDNDGIGCCHAGLSPGVVCKSGRALRSFEQNLYFEGVILRILSQRLVAPQQHDRAAFYHVTLPSRVFQQGPSATVVFPWP